MFHEKNVLNVVITLGLASIRARHSADLARIIAELNTFWSVLNACTVERKRFVFFFFIFYFSTPWAFHLRGAHTTAYSANVCRRVRYFVHTLVYVAYVRHKFFITYGCATIRCLTLSYVMYAQNFVRAQNFQRMPTYR